MVASFSVTLLASVGFSAFGVRQALYTGLFDGGLQVDRIIVFHFFGIAQFCSIWHNYTAFCNTFVTKFK
jgi:hypothetical protein